jgi:DNA helicase HerA-like ATPase
MEFKLKNIGTVIADDVSPSFDVFRFKALANEYVHPGSIVGAKIDDQRFLLGRVSGSIEVNPHESASRTAVRHAMQIAADYPAEDLSTTVYRVYEVDIIEQALLKKDQIEVTEPMDMAKAGNEVFVPSLDVVAEAMGFEKESSSSLVVGYTRTIERNSAEDDAPVMNNVLLKPEVIQRHLFIGGTTGSGKSFATGILLEEIEKFKIPIVVLDSQNEYISLSQELGGVVLKPGQDYTVRLSSLIETEVLDLVPTLRGTVGYELLAFSFLALKGEMREGRRREFSLADLITRMEADAPALEVRESSLRLGVMRTQSSIQRHNFLGETTNWIKLLDKYPIINIDCARLDLSQLRLVVGATLRELQNLRLRKEIPPYVLVLDEAHLLVPEGEDTACKQIIRENVRIGRHYGICMVLITQSPVDIDKKTIRQCNTRFMFALEPDQLHALQGVKADATEEMLTRLPKMPRGTCILSGTYETIKHAIPVKIRSDRKTTPGGTAPNIFEEVKKEWKR